MHIVISESQKKVNSYEFVNLVAIFPFSVEPNHTHQIEK